MSLDHVDLKRLKITSETRAWLTAEVHVTGRSAQEIVRDVLHSKAMEKIHAAKVLTALAADEAHIGDGRGPSGDSGGHAGDAGGHIGDSGGRRR
jgi:hypothetical protein